MTEPFGSVRYYANLFADCICDAQYDNPSSGDSIIAGFKLALKEWREYHEEQTKEYRRLEQKADDQI